tara:strand:- start:1 stop:285 length:285 start_codon:yes stop_codon:yes gene_type:complete
MIDNYTVKEYIITVTDEDNESYNLKTFANTIQEAIDNMVCMPSIKTIINIKSKDDSKSWNPKSKITLDDLREVRKEITNEKELLYTLSNNEKSN